MNVNWISDYVKACSNALTVEWFVSPLEYTWGDGKVVADKTFAHAGTPSATFDEMLARAHYKQAMPFDFRAKMMVYAFMREPIAKTYGLEIEGGLLSLYGLDFMSCLSQWIYVVEGYCRQLFQVASQSNVKSSSWTVPAVGDVTLDQTLNVVCKALGDFLDTVVYRYVANGQTTTLSRHLLLHGNLQNKAFYSQKNCLSLMYILDALVFIEMVRNRHFPTPFEDRAGEADRISRRKAVYANEMKQALMPPNLIKIGLMDEHI